MKNIETILREAGLEVTAEQLTAIKSEVSQNYKTLSEFERKVTGLQAEIDSQQKQIADAGDLLDKFSGFDPDQAKAEIEKYKAEAEAARLEGQKAITLRDQKDWINKQFDDYGIDSDLHKEYIRSKLLSDDSPVKWNGESFYGFKEYMDALNAKERGVIFKTAAQKEQDAAAQKSAAAAPKPWTESGTDTPMEETPVMSHYII